jgi:amino acid transporter
MALEEFEKEEMNDRDKGYLRMRSIMDFGMGLLWAAMGVFMIFIKKFNAELAERYDASTFKIFGAVCIVYGLFRIYRGYKKKYFRDR